MTKTDKNEIDKNAIENDKSLQKVTKTPKALYSNSFKDFHFKIKVTKTKK